MKLEKHGSVRATNDKQIVVVQAATIHLLYVHILSSINKSYLIG